MLESAAGYAPTLGILGAVMGLMRLMEQMPTAAALGPGIALAFVATVYGIGAANLVLLPIASRLRERAVTRGRRRELITNALLDMQRRLNPRLVAQKAGVFAPVPNVSEIVRHVSAQTAGARERSREARCCAPANIPRSLGDSVRRSRHHSPGVLCHHLRRRAGSIGRAGECVAASGGRGSGGRAKGVTARPRRAGRSGQCQPTDCLCRGPLDARRGHRPAGDSQLCDGSAVLTAPAQQFLRDLAGSLRYVDVQHPDSKGDRDRAPPGGTVCIELGVSTARASAVVGFRIDEVLPPLLPHRLLDLGYAEFHPRVAEPLGA